MLEINDIIEIASNDTNGKISIVGRYLVKVNFTFALTVLSDSFNGTAHFCVRKDQIKKLCLDLTQMLTASCPTTRLDDNDSDGFIEFTSNDIESVFIRGQLGGSHEDNFLTYTFLIDNLSIENLISDLKKILIYIDDEAYELEYNRKYGVD